jgi:hypothetical protein
LVNNGWVAKATEYEVLITFNVWARGKAAITCKGCIDVGDDKIELATGKGFETNVVELLPKMC